MYSYIVCRSPSIPKQNDQPAEQNKIPNSDEYLLRSPPISPKTGLSIASSVPPFIKQEPPSGDPHEILINESFQSDRELNDFKSEKEDNDNDEVKIDFVESPKEDTTPKQDAKKVAALKPKKSAENPDSDKLCIGLSEYIWSFFSRSQPLKKKVKILNQGVREIDMRLDIHYVLKKFIEIDKLIGVLFDREQIILFDNLPKPELSLKGLEYISDGKPVPRSLLRKSTIKDKELTEEEKIEEARRIIRSKVEKTVIDKKLLEAFDRNYTI